MRVGLVKDSHMTPISPGADSQMTFRSTYESCRRFIRFPEVYLPVKDLLITLCLSCFNFLF